MNTSKTDWPSSLTDDELDELDRYLRAHVQEGDDRLLLDGVHGLLSALAVVPLPVLPDEWLPEVLHEPFANEREGNRVLELLAKLNDSISAELDVDAYEPILGEIDTETGPQLSAAGWCEGFSRGIDLRAALWENRLAEDPQLMELLGPVMALAVDEGVLSADTGFERSRGVRGRPVHAAEHPQAVGRGTLDRRRSDRPHGGTRPACAVPHAH